MKKGFSEEATWREHLFEVGEKHCREKVPGRCKNVCGMGKGLREVIGFRRSWLFLGESSPERTGSRGVTWPGSAVKGSLWLEGLSLHHEEEKQ